MEQEGGNLSDYRGGGKSRSSDAEECVGPTSTCTESGPDDPEDVGKAYFRACVPYCCVIILCMEIQY